MDQNFDVPKYRTVERRNCGMKKQATRKHRIRPLNRQQPAICKANDVWKSLKNTIYSFRFNVVVSPPPSLFPFSPIVFGGRRFCQFVCVQRQIASLSNYYFSIRFSFQYVGAVYMAIFRCLINTIYVQHSIVDVRLCASCSRGFTAAWRTVFAEVACGHRPDHDSFRFMNAFRAAL